MIAVVPSEARAEHAALGERLVADKLRPESVKTSKSEIESLCWSASGDRFFTSSREGVVRGFRADRLSEDRVIVGTWSCADAHPTDTNLLALISWEGVLRLVDLRSGSAAVEEDLKKLNPQIDHLLGVTWNVEGTALALHTREDYLQAVNYSAGDLTLAGEGLITTSDIYATCWDSSGCVWTALGGTPGKILVNGPRTAELVAHQYATAAICRNRDGSIIVSGGQDSLAVIWDARELAAVRSFPGATAPVSCVGMSSDSSVLAWGCGGLGKDVDSILYLGGVRTGAQYTALPTPAPVNRVSWHPSRPVVAFSLAGDAGTVQVLSLI